MTYRSSEDFAQETSAFRRFVYGMIRRFAVTLTDTALWQLLGQTGGAGGDEILSDVPAFTGIGFYSRPPSSGGNPEAIGVSVGGTRTTVIVAARDEATRQAVVGDLPPDSAAMFNTKAVILINPDDTIEVGAGPSVQPTIMGTSYRSAEDTMLSALATCLTAINAYATSIQGTADPTKAATPALTVAIQTMNTAIATFQGQAAGYLTTVLKAQ